MVNYHPERRSSPRIERGLPLKISCGEFDLVTETKNISAVGAYCIVDRYLAPMTKLAILLLLPFSNGDKVINKKVNCEGIVVRVDEPREGDDKYRIAIYFNEINPRDKKTLTEFLSFFPTK
ncbi:MAG: PilZ domain-containing protein [Elusimicrobiota bacterium]